MNDEICEGFPGTLFTFYSSDNIIDDNEAVVDNYPIEFLNELTPSGCPPHKLKLKEGTIVMLLRNLNVRTGLCNGTRCLIRKLHQHFIDVEIISGNGRRTCERTFIPRIDFIPIDIDLPFGFKRRQYPLRIAYAVTINKSQGQTYDCVGIYLRDTVFTHGQLYVAFSRAKQRNSVFILIQPTLSQGRRVPQSNVIYTKNIVFREALQ